MLPVNAGRSLQRGRQLVPDGDRQHRVDRWGWRALRTCRAGGFWAATSTWTSWTSPRTAAGADDPERQRRGPHPAPVLPGEQDIDLYRFELQDTGRFSAETYAERQRQASRLDSVLTLYRRTRTERGSCCRGTTTTSAATRTSAGSGTGRVLCGGLVPAATASTIPTIEDSGFGGTTQGEYDLRFDFRPAVDRAIDIADQGLYIAKERGRNDVEPDEKYWEATIQLKR